MSEEMNLYKRCKNIFKAHGVDMGGGGGESAPEVENAIETHGLGWTDAEGVVHQIDQKYIPVIPVAPSEDGTYKLTCTVTDGEPVYSWESISESVN